MTEPEEVFSLVKECAQPARRSRLARRALCALCPGLLGRPASESGTLSNVDRVQGRGDCLRRAFMLPILYRRIQRGADV